MDRRLRAALLITDVGFLLYWSAAALACAGVLHLPAAWMYAGYGQPQTDAWNWSFLPLDVAFSAAGLAAVRLARAGDPRWRPMAMASLILTIVAGAMAIGYWTLLGEFKPEWFLPNLLLAVWPWPFLVQLFHRIGRDELSLSP